MLTTSFSVLKHLQILEKKNKYQILPKIRPLGAELFRADRRTDTDTTKLEPISEIF